MHAIRGMLKDYLVQIIYISAYTKYAAGLFEMKPLNFLEKPLTEKKIRMALSDALNWMNHKGDIFEYKAGPNTYRVLIGDIYYFRRDKREIEIVTKKKRESFYGNLEAIEARLSDYNFFICHQSYLVNYSSITRFGYTDLELSNGDCIPISQGRRKAVRELQKKLERGGL